MKSAKESPATETYFCEKGQMELSQHLAKRFRECFEKRTSLPMDLPFSFQIGGNWYCPGCGGQAIEQEGMVRCSLCNLCLNEFMYQLVEFHPHS